MTLQERKSFIKNWKLLNAGRHCKKGGCSMKRYRYFFIDYDRYVVFTNNGVAVTRRLYNNGNGTYYFRFKNEKITVSEDQLYM